MASMKEGFGIRLGRAIDRWPGGGQRAFAEAFREYARQNDLNVPTSPRTLTNYLNGSTTPPRAWVDAAAAVLRWNPDNLLTGEEPERPGQHTSSGLTIGFQDDAAPRASALIRLTVNRPDFADLPMSARFMVYRFLDDYYGDDLEGWGGGSTVPAERREAVDAILADYFAPLLARPKMDAFGVMALAASLVAAAYVRIGANNGHHETREDS